MASSSSSFDLSFLDDGEEVRLRSRRNRVAAGFVVPLLVTLIWMLVVAAGGFTGRVVEHFLSAITMTLGSFVAGSTPQGGGAVAFPVFTKALAVPAETARSFSLCIQAVGMSCASCAIVASGRTVAWRAVRVAAPAGIIAFVLTLLLAGEPHEPFWPSRLPGAYVKVTFTLVVAAMGWIVLVGLRMPIRSVRDAMPALDRRLISALVVAGVLGGTASALVGSGADVFTYLAVVVLIGVRSGVGVPTSVITMAIVSVTGFVVLGLIDRQLFVVLASNGEVTEVGGHLLVPARPMRQADLFGMWLAAIPVVAWGAPIGAWVASRMKPRTLVLFALAVAVAEVVSTILFLEELRSDLALVIYSLAGLVVAIGGITLLANKRRALFGLAEADWTAPITRSTVEVAPTYRRDIAEEQP